MLTDKIHLYDGFFRIYLKLYIKESKKSALKYKDLIFEKLTKKERNEMDELFRKTLNKYAN